MSVFEFLGFACFVCAGAYMALSGVVVFRMGGFGGLSRTQAAIAALLFAGGVAIVVAAFWFAPFKLVIK